VACMVFRAGMGDTKNVNRILVGEHEEYRLLGIWKAMLKIDIYIYMVSLCLQANAEMVPKFPSCHYMPLM